MVFDADSPEVDQIVVAANQEPRRGIERPTMLVLHYTGMQNAQKAVRWLSLAESRVSCHYVIDEAGRITQMVPERLRAWHAGVSCWHGETDLNSASIGIEIHNPGHEDGYTDFPAAQIAAVIALSRDIVVRNRIAVPRVLAHSDIAPLRKIDPGEKFPWNELAAAGVGAWVPPSPVVLGGLDSAADLAFDNDGDLLFVDWFQAVVGEIDDATGQHPARQDLVDYGAVGFSAVSWVSSW